MRTFLAGFRFSWLIRDIICVQVGFVSRQKFSVVVIVEGGSGYIKGAQW